MKHGRAAILAVGLMGYLAAFYASTPRDSVGQPMCNDVGRQVHRAEQLFPILFRPEEWLLPNWFGNPLQFHLLDRAPVVLISAAILLWAAAVGLLALRLLRLHQRLTGLERLLFAVGVGLNALSAWTLLLGLFGRLDRTWLVLVPATATFLAMAAVMRSKKIWRAGESSLDAGATMVLGGAEDRANVRWLWAGLPFVAMIFWAAMLPPLDFDVCEYHLQAPKEFFQQGRIAFVPHNVYANMPLGTEMLSLLAMVVAGDWWWGALAGKTVIAAFTPLCALALYAAGRRWHSTRAGVLAAVLYLSIPWIVSVSSSGLVEGALACYLFLALYATLLWKETVAAAEQSGTQTGALGFAALAGYLAGGAAATKYPAVLFVLMPLAVVIFLGAGIAANGTPWPKERAKPRQSPFEAVLSMLRGCWSRQSAKALGVFVLAAAVGCGLWFGKNWVLAGNPTYPLLYNVFEGKSWNAEKDARWNRVHRPHDFSGTSLGADLGRVLLTGAGLSPLIAPLAVLALLRAGATQPSTKRREQTGPDFAASAAQKPKPLEPGSHLVWGLLAYAGYILTMWWLLTHRIDRFWMPMLPILALLAGVGACWTLTQWWRRMLAGFLAVGLAGNFLLASAAPGNAWFVPLDHLRDRINPWHWYFNNDPSAGGVLAVGEAAVFDLASPVLYNTCFDDCVFEAMVKGKTSEQVREALAAQGIGYVFVSWGEIERYRRTYGFSEFVQPEVFDWLVKEGVLEPVEPLPDRPERAYRVVKPSREP